ncbi:TonB-dependent receptor [Sandarakinorhabdus cyanobacteriorum]|uniref:TonB-dependent receptor n=1 Tax=Sandarakinorhabdus cyanobacteriorum TaxID=1981098 RepID=A0A255YPS8_9SPHN|nr:TonB-dependent receptor [Sandarakinorhabdus cyanobacteriorum]OYQ31203.1 TonB-dependent receptor [Sandarakinorhabdus cyanobacteriorum]
MTKPISFVALLLLSAMPVAAEEAPADRQHGEQDPEIIVTAPYARDRKLVATAISVLSGEDLQRQTRSTIGETLARQPGVTSSFFGPNASRPILRGLDNERVRVLTDGIGSFDVSNTSVDHAVAANPLLADRVEIVRGPAALLYGSGAIGGVVNMRDLRIPRELPDGTVHVDAVAGLASAAEERNVAASLNASLGGGFVAHVDASIFGSGDYRTGGFIFGRELRKEAAEEGGEVAEEAQARGRVDNTSARTWDVGGGIAWIGEGGASFGLAVSHLANRYGIPNTLEIEHHDDHAGHDDDHDEHAHEDITLDMRQTRVDVRASLPLGGPFKQLNVRGGWADYQHDEIEDNGEIGTSFFNKSWEGRIELVQEARGGWQGASGVQYFSRNFRAVGEEAYIPANETRQIGLFTLQELDLGQVRLEGGARYERANVKSAIVGRERRFDSFSLSAGGSVDLGGGFRLAASLARTERAPSAEELFANGAHAATRAFEIGNLNFRTERQLGAEAVLRGRGSGWRIELSAFLNRFDNYIFLSPTGAEEDELPVFQYAQADARFYGFEIEGAVKLAQLGQTRIDLTGMLDYTRADILRGGGAVPRIPPLRMIGGVEASGGDIGGRLELEHVTRQDRIAGFETESPAFTLVNASLSWKPFGPDSATSVIVQANNIFDVEARRHSSFLKDVAPLFGRDFRLSIRTAF